MPFFIFGLFLVLMIVVGVLGWLAEKRRREAFQALAQRLGLRYQKKDPSIAQRFEFLDKLRQGENRYAFNILDGQFEEQPVMVFDFHYETHSTDSKGRRQTHNHYFSFFILFEEKVFPELRIYPENILSKLGQMLGFDDIDFESAEFSRAFTVRSKDKKFAYDICHTRMMRYLLEHRDLSVEIEKQCVSMSFNSRLKPEQIEGRLRQLVEIRKLFPEYLYSE
jgi:hypothetical protein